MTADAGPAAPAAAGRPQRSFRVREVVPGDADAIARLADELGYPTTAQEAADRLASVAGRPDHRVLVAEGAEGPVGWIHFFVQLQIESPPFAEIRGLIVSEASRGLGVGAALVAAGESWARERGLRELRVRSNVVRERAHRFYERLGFTTRKRQVVLNKELRPERG